MLRLLCAQMAAMKEWTECGYFEWLKKLDTYVATQCGPSGFLVGDQVLCCSLLTLTIICTLYSRTPPVRAVEHFASHRIREGLQYAPKLPILSLR